MIDNMAKKAQVAQQIKYQVEVLDVLLGNAKDLDIQVTLFQQGTGKALERAEMLPLQASIRAVL